MVGPPFDELNCLVGNEASNSTVRHETSATLLVWPASYSLPVSGTLLVACGGRRVVRLGKAKPILHTMNSKIALCVTTHGVALIVLALLIHRVAPEMARVTLITGLAGGALCALWGVLGLLGHRRRVGAVLTLIPVSLVLLPQVVSAWMDRGAGKSESLFASALMTVMLVASVGMLAYLLHAGENSTDAQGAKASGPQPKLK
jgi:hypothetical protein